MAAPLLLLGVVAGALLSLDADHLGLIVSWWQIIPAGAVLPGPVVLLALVLLRLRRCLWSSWPHATTPAAILAPMPPPA